MTEQARQYEDQFTVATTWKLRTQFDGTFADWVKFVVRSAEKAVKSAGL